MEEQIRSSELFDLTQTMAADLLKTREYPWEILGDIHDFIIKLGNTLEPEIYEKKGENIWIAKSASVFESASITGPCIIGERTQVRHCAFIRGDALVGNDCVIGNSAELKNVIIFNNCEVPHYNYVGDSVLGFHAHMGAGSITSNIKADRQNIKIRCSDKIIETGRRKIGAMLGDYAEIGCNAVLNPGTIVGKNTNIFPTACVRGVVPSGCIMRNTGELVEKK